MGILAHLTRGFRVYNTFEIMKKDNPIHYRNIEDFQVNELESVDSGSLWELNNSKLVLVDDDNYLETNLDLEKFELLK